MTEQRKAIAYIRVSTDEQAISELSLRAQHREVVAYAERSGVDIVSVLADENESASTLNRPAVSGLLTHIDSGQVDAVIISKLDRLTRRIKDFMSLLQRMRIAKRADGGQGVDLISSAESLDTGSAAGQIVINIMDSVSQWDREVIGERTSTALQELKAQGKSTGNPNYGYEAGEDGKLIENEQEQAVLHRVAELRAQGKSWARVASSLTDAGVRTRRGTVFSRQGLSKIAKRAGIQ
ncbi:MAG: recombinase family protein [Caldilineaceae bacterium]|nr:recombinase family protein [Caldilineaceae bacterium]